MRLPHFDASQPLGLPPGSIEAIIAIVLVGACVVQVVRGEELDRALIVATAVVLTFYFKRGEDEKVPYVEALPDPVMD